MECVKNKNYKKTIIGIIIACILIAVIPLIFIKSGEFAGADGLAENMINEINPDYEPWAKSLIELPSGEVESLLFALQAAIGAGIIGFGIGTFKERSKHRKKGDKKIEE